MTVLPEGSPIWARNANITTYGGDVNKKNLDNVGVVDPTTDVSAEQYSRLVDDTSAMTRVIASAVITLDNTGVLTYNGLNGVGLSFAPTYTNVSTGVYKLTFPTSYTDSYGNVQSFSIGQFVVSANNTNGYLAVASLSGQDLTIKTFSLSSGLVAADSQACVWIL